MYSIEKLFELKLGNFVGKKTNKMYCVVDSLKKIRHKILIRLETFEQPDNHRTACIGYTMGTQK